MSRLRYRAAKLATAAALILSTLPAFASSHREAPLITEKPKADGTDFYMFRSYEPGRQDFVTLIANYMPLQDPIGGPNYFTLDDDAIYEIHIDNDGNSQEDLTFQFRPSTTIQDIQLPIGPPGSEIMVSVPLINVGPITSPGDPNQNVLESYTLDVITGDRRTGTRQAISQAGPYVSAGLAMGVLLDPADAPVGLLPFTDGAIVDSSFLDEAFPYLRTPLPGAVSTTTSP